MFSGIVYGDPNQRVLIPITGLKGAGVAIAANQALTSAIDGKTSFKPTKLKLTLPDGKDRLDTSRVELNGELKFDALDGAGVRLDGDDRLIGGTNGFSPAISSTTLPVVASGADPNGNSTPITFTLADLQFQTDKLAATYDTATRKFQFSGTSTARFDGGSVVIEVPHSGVLSDVTTPGDKIQWGSSSLPPGNLQDLINNSSAETISGGSGTFPVFGELATGPVVIQGLRISTAGSERKHDPNQYSVYGVKEVATGFGGTRTVETLLSRGVLSLPSGRNTQGSVITFDNTVAYSTYTVKLENLITYGYGEVRVSEIDVLGRVHPLSLTNGVFPNTLSELPIKAVTLGGLSFKPDGLSLSVDQATNQVSIRGRASPLSAAEVNFGAVGFGAGIDGDSGDSDTRTGEDVVIKDGRLERFSLPLTALATSDYTFTNRGTDQKQFMRAEFDPLSNSYRIVGNSQTMTRKGSINGISNSSDTSLTANVRLTLPGDDGDVIRPGDTISDVSTRGQRNLPNAIDDRTDTEDVIIFDKSNGGLEVTPSAGASVVTALRLTTGNDKGKRFYPHNSVTFDSSYDPATFKLEGKVGNNAYKLIAEGNLSLPTARNASRVIQFDNTKAYTSYRLTFPSNNGAYHVYFAEVSLIATPIDLTAGAHIVNGKLAGFRIPVESFSLRADANQEFAFREKSRNGLIAAFDATHDIFSIAGTASLKGPIEQAGSVFDSNVELGTKGTEGLILNAKAPSLDRLSFAMLDDNISSRKISGKDLMVNYNSGAKAFEYSGTAHWLYNNKMLPVSIVGSTSVPSALRGYDFHGPVRFNGLNVTNIGIRYPNGDIVNGPNGQATVLLEGKTVPVTPVFRISGGQVVGQQRFLTPARFSLSGFALENPSGILHFPRSGSNSKSSFAYEVGTIDFKIGDVSGKTRASLLLDLKDGGLRVGDKATFTFEAIRIQDIEFASGALVATYSLTDRRFTFSGTGRYRGLDHVSVTVGGDPKNPQLIEERGVFKLTNFTPPAVDFQVAAVIFPTKPLGAPTEDGNLITYRGDVTISVGGAQIKLKLGGGKTKGLVYDKTAKKVVAIGATVEGTFTIGGSELTLTGKFGYDSAKNEYEISGQGDFRIRTSTGPLTLKIKLTKLIIKDGQVTELTASVSSRFKLLGLDIDIDDLGITYTRVGQEYGFHGSVQISTAPVGGKRFLDKFKVSLGTGPHAPGLVVKQGELESFDFALNGTINLFGVSATPRHLRVKYSRATNVLALTGGLTVTIANKFTATAAFPGQGLLINVKTGQVELKGLHLSVGDVNFGALKLRKISFTYLVDSNNNTTISGEAEVSLPGNITVGAEITIKNNRLSAIGLSFEKLPGIQIGNTGVFLYSISGKLTNLDDLANFQIDATVKASGGPATKIFGKTKALMAIEGTISVNRHRLEISGNVKLLDGVLGSGSGRVTIFFSGQQVIDAQANFSMYGGIFKGDLSFKLDRDFNLAARTTFSVNIPDAIPKIGGKSLGTLNAFIWVWPNKERKHSAVWVDGRIKVGPFKFKFGVGVNFEGKVYGGVTIFGKNVGFEFQVPGLREFTIPNLDELVEQLARPTMDILGVTPAAGTPGATVTFAGTTELPDDTTFDLFVDTELDSYGGHRIATGLSFSAGEQTFTWDDLAAYAAIPYDPSKPVYVYGAIDNGTAFPVFTAYSNPIVPPDYTPVIDVPAKGDYGTNQDLIFSTMTDNAIRIDDPLAAPLPDSQVFVEVSAHHGRLELMPENAHPWQNLTNPLDVDLDGNTALTDALKIADLLNHPSVLVGGGKLPTTRSATSDLPLYDVNGDGLVTSADVSLSANSLVGIADSVTTVTSTGVQVEGDGTEVITLTGTAADVNAALDGLTYHPYENNFFDDEISVSVNRYPAFYVETIDASIPVTAHPLTLGTDDGSGFLPTTYEQGSGHQTLLDHVMIHDAASGHIDGAIITIGNYQEGKDLLDLDIEDQMDLGVHATFDAHKGILRLSGFATVEEYQQALHLISFSSTGTGDKTLTIKMGDDVNDLAELTELVHIIVVNQAPAVDPGMGTIFTAGGGTAAALPGLTVTDPERDTISGATFALDAMTYIQGQDVLSFVHQHGIDGSFDAATGVLTLTGTASAAHYTAALRSVQYSNLAVPATTGIRELTVTVNDGQIKNPEASAMERLLVVSSGVTLMGPTLSNLPTATIATPVDETPVFLAPDLLLTDPEMVVETLIGADVAITGNFVAGDDFLNVKGLPEGITASFNPLTGVLHLTGCAPVSYYEYALQQVTYSDHETVRDGLPRTITFTAHDGFTTATPQSLTVQAEALPVVEAGFGALVYTHGQTSAAIDPELIVEYNGGTTLSGAEVAIIWDYMADEDRLVFADQNGITGAFDQMDGVLTLTGTASVADYQTALRSVQYRNTRVNPISGYREVEFHVSDGQKVSDQGDLLLADFLIDVETEYVPPVLSLDTTPRTFVENS
ncbi:MAG: hypothetical protein GY878_31275, partial [Fuerstiella sp.]|nr:hypothetical protein [Fuerstiella sp.]